MKRTSLAFTLAMLAPAAVASAAEVAMAPVQCTNLTDGECAAVGAVFSGAFATASGAQVTMAPAGAPTGANSAYSPPTAVERLTVTATRLTSRISLRAALNRTDGTPIHAVEMTATSLDDLPPAAERMSQALVHRTSVGETMTLHNITKTEGAKVNRTTTEKVMGMKTGLIVPFASGVDIDNMLSFQFDGRFESDRYFLEFGAGAVLPSSTEGHKRYGGLFAEFGASAYLGPLGSPIYLGGGISPRLFFSSDDGGVRAAGYGQLGVMFMRTSSTRLYMELRVLQNLMAMNLDGGNRVTTPTGGTQVTTSKAVYPTEFASQIGIGW